MEWAVPAGREILDRIRSNKFDSEITTTVVHTTNVNTANQIVATGQLDRSNFLSYLTIELDHSFRYEILSQNFEQI